MIYALVRGVVALAISLFYRLEVRGAPEDGSLDEGPVMFVGNHPNALIDPALVFILTRRQITFLAKAPLFQTPLLGTLLRALGALPVYRRQDDPALMGRNDGTLRAAADALVAGRAITLFPEGKSHSEPALAELKTGAARIAFQGARPGAAVRVVPVGLTYAEKHRFRSQVLIEVGTPLVVSALEAGSDEPEQVRRLTERISEGLKAVTLNLETWGDLPLLQLAGSLYAFRRGEAEEDPARLRRFAEGLGLFRSEQPVRFEALRGELVQYGRRLAVVRARPSDLALLYQRGQVFSFALRNGLALLLGFPLFGLGVVLFAVPYSFPRLLVRRLQAERDVEATYKFLAAALLAPVWWALLTSGAWVLWGARAAAWIGAWLVPHALFTRYFYERRQAAWADVRVFIKLGSRASLKARLLSEGERLAREVEQVADAYRARLTPGGG